MARWCCAPAEVLSIFTARSSVSESILLQPDQAELIERLELIAVSLKDLLVKLLGLAQLATLVSPTRRRWIRSCVDRAHIRPRSRKYGLDRTILVLKYSAGKPARRCKGCKYFQRTKTPAFCGRGFFCG
jgi:hypothetical protein